MTPRFHLVSYTILFKNRRPVPDSMEKADFYKKTYHIKSWNPLGWQRIQLSLFSYELQGDYNPKALAVVQIKSCTLVTIPLADKLPLSASLLTANSEMSTQ